MMTKPFKLDNIKKVTRHETDLIRALYEFLPATDVRDRIHVAIRKVLIKHLGQDLRYYLSAAEKKGFNEFTATLPESPVIMVLGLAPIAKKAFVHFDNNIANLVINKLLGGGEGSSGELKSLTETEQGVLQYLIMQVLSQIHALAGAESRVHFRFEKFLFDAKEISKYSKAQENVYILHMEVGMLNQSGFVRIVFPYPFLEELLSLPSGAGDTAEERTYFGRQLARWGFISTSAWAEAGNSFLSPAEIKDLEGGDVVLFDETALKLTGKGMEGSMLIHFGTGESGISSQLVGSDAKAVRCRLNNLVK